MPAAEIPTVRRSPHLEGLNRAARPYRDGSRRYRRTRSTPSSGGGYSATQRLPRSSTRVSVTGRPKKRISRDSASAITTGAVGMLEGAHDAAQRVRRIAVRADQKSARRVQK